MVICFSVLLQHIIFYFFMRFCDVYAVACRLGFQRATRCDVHIVCSTACSFCGLHVMCAHATLCMLCVRTPRHAMHVMCAHATLCMLCVRTPRYACYVCARHAMHVMCAQFFMFTHTSLTHRLFVATLRQLQCSAHTRQAGRSNTLT